MFHRLTCSVRSEVCNPYDVDHVCMKSKPVDVNVSAAAFIAAVDMQISQTATTLAVVFELFSTKQEKLLR